MLLSLSRKSQLACDSVFVDQLAQLLGMFAAEVMALREVRVEVIERPLIFLERLSFQVVCDCFPALHPQPAMAELFDAFARNATGDERRIDRTTAASLCPETVHRRRRHLMTRESFAAVAFDCDSTLSTLEGIDDTRKVTKEAWYKPIKQQSTL